MFQACVASGSLNSLPCKTIQAIFDSKVAPVSAPPAASVHFNTTLQILNGMSDTLQIFSTQTSTGCANKSLYLNQFDLSRVFASGEDIDDIFLLSGTASIPLKTLYKQFQTNPRDGVQLCGFKGCFFPIYQCPDATFGTLFSASLGILYTTAVEGFNLVESAYYPMNVQTPFKPSDFTYPIAFTGTFGGGDSFIINLSSATSLFPYFDPASPVWASSLTLYTWINSLKVCVNPTNITPRAPCVCQPLMTFVFSVLRQPHKSLFPGFTSAEITCVQSKTGLTQTISQNTPFSISVSDGPFSLYAVSAPPPKSNAGSIAGTSAPGVAPLFLGTVALTCVTTGAPGSRGAFQITTSGENLYLSPDTCSRVDLLYSSAPGSPWTYCIGPNCSSHAPSHAPFHPPSHAPFHPPSHAPVWFLKHSSLL